MVGQAYETVDGTMLLRKRGEGNPQPYPQVSGIALGGYSKRCWGTVDCSFSAGNGNRKSPVADAGACSQSS